MNFFSFLIGFYFFIHSTISAANTNTAVVASVCIKEGCSSPRQELQVAVEACKLEVYQNACKQFGLDHPEYDNLIKKCDPQSVCEEAIDYLNNNLKACKDGVLDAWSDFAQGVKDISLGVANFVNNFIEEKRDEFRNPLRKPLAKAPNSVTPAEVFQKLGEVTDSTEQFFKTAHLKYQCFKEIPKYKLQCYVIGGIIDPALMTGYALKLARGGLVIAAKQGAKTFRSARNSLHSGSVKERNSFKAKYAEYSPTTSAENEAWMLKAKQTKPKKGEYYFDVENSELKNLNDTFKDRDFATSLTNHHKKLLFDEIEELQKKYPGLVVDKYSDFKASRFMFSGEVPGTLKTELDKLHQRVNQRYAIYLNEHGFDRKNDKANLWFRAGYGETADQATQASRFSRRMNDNKLYSFNDSIVTLEQYLTKAEDKRRLLTENFSISSGVIDQGTLHTDAFDIIRKNPDNLAKAKAEIQNRFALKTVSDDNIQRMHDYVREVDEFSAGIHVKERVFVTLADAHHGGMTADMVGLGAANMRETALALKNSKSVTEAIENSRKAEQKVTKEFEVKKRSYEEALEEAVGRERIKTICSGDDCAAIPNFKLSESDKSKVVQEIAKRDLKLRMSFIAPDIKDVSVRNQLGNHGEGIEKSFRTLLSSRMEPNKIEGLVFAMDMRTSSLNQGAVRLVTGTRNNVNLSKSDKELLEKTFIEATKIFNDIQKKNGVNVSDYHGKGFWP